MIGKYSDRKRALDRARKALDAMTDEEDEVITKDAKNDPDNPPADDLFRRSRRTGGSKD